MSRCNSGTSPDNSAAVSSERVPSTVLFRTHNPYPPLERSPVELSPIIIASQANPQPSDNTHAVFAPPPPLLSYSTIPVVQVGLFGDRQTIEELKSKLRTTQILFKNANALHFKLAADLAHASEKQKVNLEEQLKVVCDNLEKQKNDLEVISNELDIKQSELTTKELALEEKEKQLAVEKSKLDAGIKEDARNLAVREEAEKIRLANQAKKEADEQLRLAEIKAKELRLANEEKKRAAEEAKAQSVLDRAIKIADEYDLKEKRAAEKKMEKERADKLEAERIANARAAKLAAKEIKKMSTLVEKLPEAKAVTIKPAKKNKRQVKEDEFEKILAEAQVNAGLFTPARNVRIPDHANAIKKGIERYRSLFEVPVFFAKTIDFMVEKLCDDAFSENRLSGFELKQLFDALNTIKEKDNQFMAVVFLHVFAHDIKRRRVNYFSLNASTLPEYDYHSHIAINMVKILELLTERNLDKCPIFHGRLDEQLMNIKKLLMNVYVFLTNLIIKSFDFALPLRLTELKEMIEKIINDMALKVIHEPSFIIDAPFRKNLNDFKNKFLEMTADRDYLSLEIRCALPVKASHFMKNIEQLFPAIIDQGHVNAPKH
ncbi:MAG: hypothetical protein A3E82_05080 [Gammaproteobacteria bacterium RIFCSPHIGHO2_12_FULL_38_11]|nr:MAG: hypothetical protein A3E82_05080 [Gammaproteobacteria bacterium RIFCSPHIGHO2_12_FULL_38_11]